MPKGVPKNGKGGQFKPGQDTRRNPSGQRNAAAVAFNRELRSIIAEVGNEEIKKGTKTRSRIELAVRGLYEKAEKGDVSAFNALVERVEGKVTQPVKHEFSDLSDDELITRVTNLLAGLAPALRGSETPGTPPDA